MLKDAILLLDEIGEIKVNRNPFKSVFLSAALMACSLVLVSCATIFSVSPPDISSKEYSLLRISNARAADCYVEKFRIGALLLDILVWPAAVVDGLAGQFTYYAYEPAACVENQARRNMLASTPQEQPLVYRNSTDNAQVNNYNQGTTPQKKAKVSTRPIFVAVLESSSGGILDYQETQFITNVLREEAVKSLSADLNVTIMTRENIIEMLPPDKSLEDCEGACIVETGKNISADYVSQARIGKFGKNLTISVELYKTSNNKLISSFNTKAQDIDYLEEKVRENISPMFREIVREETEY